MNPGLRNGFIDLWPEYLEIITVQDEAAFAADDDPGNDYLRGARGGPPGPGALEQYSEDVARLREAMTTAGHQVPVVVESRMAGTDAKDRPDFYFLDLAWLPGPPATAMTSTHPSTPMRHQIKIAPNPVFALGGLSLVSGNPARIASSWSELLDPGAHSCTVHSTAGWQATSGELATADRLVCLHLLAVDPHATLRAMSTAGWSAGKDLQGRRHLRPRPADGFRFTVEHGDSWSWRDRRQELLGEQLEIIDYR